jgi:hypothetical protein
MGKKRWILFAVTFIGAVFLITARTYALDQYDCLSCHGDPNLTKNINGVEISLYVSGEDLDDSAHQYVDCTLCHTTNPHSLLMPINKVYQAKVCGECHEYEYSQFLQSIHGEQLVAGNPDVPTCADCHSLDGNPHSVGRVLQYTSPTYQSNIAHTCGKCHNNPDIMSSYNIVENVYQTYLQSVHGKALQLSSDEVAQVNIATCISCHGTHDILSINNPSSSVAGEANLLKTCQQCHPGAGPQFVKGFPGHKEASPQNIPAAFYSQYFFRILLIVVLSFGAIVIIAAIVRFSINRWRE